MSKLHRGKTLRLERWDYSMAAAYFITICTKGRLPLLGDISDRRFYPSSYGSIVHQTWFDLTKYYDCILDAFVTMPDHIHGIIFIPRTDVEAIHELPLHQEYSQSLDRQCRTESYRAIRRRMMIPKMIGRFKMQSGKMINQLRETVGQTVWQRDYYETIIKTPKQLQNVRQYIQNNPANWSTN